jgi:TPR repeat protein
MGVRKMFDGIISEGEPVMLLKEAIRHLQADADHGNAHSQSTLAFLVATGVGLQQSDSKAFLYHHFAAKGGNFQSKMALAYTYSRQQVDIKLSFKLSMSLSLCLSLPLWLCFSVSPPLCLCLLETASN